MKRTTIREVAARAGVSMKTVSRVLNAEPHVTEAVRDRVNEAIRDLDYHPNVLAQGLVRRRSFLIGLVYENPSPSYVVELQMGVLDGLRDSRYRLIVLPVQSVHNRAVEIVGLLRSAALDGVVLSPPASDHPRILGDLRSIQMPHARIAPTQDLTGGASTLLDDAEAAREIAAYVICLGHRRIAIVLGDPTHAAAETRMSGYRQAFADAGLTIDPALVAKGMFTFASGFAAGRVLLLADDPPTAILAQNDDMAVGAMMAAREQGLSVPDQLSIVGFDDSEISRITWPRLTTIRQPVYDMAKNATDMLLREIAGEGSEAPALHAHTLLVRESTAPPPDER